MNQEEQKYNPNYEKRYRFSEDVAKRLDDLCLGTILGGSVAESPARVTELSDVDINTVADFQRLNFNDFFEKIRQRYDSCAAEAAKKGKVDILVIRWREDFDKGIHLWDRSVLETIKSLHGHVRILREHGFNGVSKTEELINLKGKVLEKGAHGYPNYRDYLGGRVVQKVCPVFIDYEEGEVYLSALSKILLRHPRILRQHNNCISQSLEEFEHNLKQKLKEIYGTTNTENSLMHTISKEIQNRLPQSLVTKLTTFF